MFVLYIGMTSTFDAKSTPKLARVNNLPTPDQIRQAISAVIADRYGRGGLKAFAAEAGFPYDRVRDHLRNESKMTVDAMYEYMAALDLSMLDLMQLAEALPQGERREA